MPLDLTTPKPRAPVLHIARDPRVVSGVGSATLCGGKGTYISAARAAGRNDVCPDCTPPDGRPRLPKGLRLLDIRTGGQR